MKKYICANNLVIEVTALNDQNIGPFYGEVLKMAGLATMAGKYDIFLRQQIEGTSQELVIWISQNANISTEEARIGFKRFILIWGLCTIMVVDSLQPRVEMLRLLTHSFCDVISPGKTKISITELQKIIQEEGIDAYEAHDFIDGFFKTSQKYFSILIKNTHYETGESEK
ncbi:hypothetical protein SLH46_09380 [Draconibacterium sp. IB214405]|uniref:hypothetical protein n=1 Tax=Draconibacterium sp. IB214405 TaxID=3097352 RepID=UPI002A147C69|nr:hypothetical protein [Draconibacterium sp. IB214405]MDX8339392.1 hypothetical protein [Draconibacterium sp. IB214405]